MHQPFALGPIQLILGSEILGDSALPIVAPFRSSHIGFTCSRSGSSRRSESNSSRRAMRRRDRIISEVICRYWNVRWKISMVLRKENIHKLRSISLCCIGVQATRTSSKQSGHPAMQQSEMLLCRKKGDVMREEGIEPPTAGSGIQRSTTELFPHCDTQQTIPPQPHIHHHKRTTSHPTCMIRITFK